MMVKYQYIYCPSGFLGMWCFGFSGFCLFRVFLGESGEAHLFIFHNIFPGFVITGVYIASR